MAYTKRDWDNTDTKVTKADFKRMDNGIETNDLAVTELAQLISALNVDRGYAISKEVANFNVSLNGKYLVNHSASLSDAPLASVVSGKWMLDVTANSGWVSQTATLAWSDLTGFNDRGKTFTRIFVDSVWSPWKQLTTLTQTQAMLDALNA